MAPNVDDIEGYLRAMEELEPRRHETLVPNILTCVGICAAVSVLILTLRILSRFSSGIKFAAHDYLVFVGWAFLLGQLGTLGGMARHGLGRHANTVTEESDIRAVQILNLTNEIMYFLCIGFFKLSMSALYMAIFPQAKAHWACWGVIAIAGGWMISATFATIFMCNPPHRTWDPFGTEGTCIDFQALLGVMASLNIFTDVVLLAIPIPLILQLRVNKHKKALILMTFAVGGIACAASCIRLYYIFALKGSYDGTWDTTFLLEVSSAELLICFLCACLPTYGPLYRRVFKGSLDTSKASSHPQNQVGGMRYRNDISAGHRSLNIHGGTEVDHSKPGIYVTKDIGMSTFTKKKTATWVRVDDEDETRLTTNVNRHPTGSDGQSFETLPGSNRT